MTKEVCVIKYGDLYLGRLYLRGAFILDFTENEIQRGLKASLAAGRNQVAWGRNYAIKTTQSPRFSPTGLIVNFEIQYGDYSRVIVQGRGII